MIAGSLAAITGKAIVRSSTIRAMASRGQLPAPTGLRWRRRALWASAEIEAWLRDRRAAQIPNRTVQALQRRLTVLDERSRASGDDAELREAVRDARRQGLSLRQVAEAIKAKNGDHHPSREAVRSRFGHSA